MLHRQPATERELRRRPRHLKKRQKKQKLDELLRLIDLLKKKLDKELWHCKRKRKVSRKLGGLKRKQDKNMRE